MVVSTGILLILNGHSRRQVNRRGFVLVKHLKEWGRLPGFLGTHILGKFGVSTRNRSRPSGRKRA